jgi:hypothetical protein
MLIKLRDTINKKLFDLLTNGIVETPPMPVIPASVTFTSIVTDDFVQMFLLSMKSFYRHMGKGKILAIVRSDMSQEARTMLERHFPGIEFQVIDDINVGPCQRGGCWERLLTILDRSKDEYVVQVDSDTLSVGADLNEVRDCIDANRAFTLSGGEREIVSVAEAAKRADCINHPYVGLAVERTLPRYPGAEHLLYVRGSAGFAGFAKGGFDRSKMDEFHMIMGDLMGNRWTEWGTEQCASNFAVANTPGSIVLPYPKYANFESDVDETRASFLHFIGSHRYKKGIYLKTSKKLISELLAIH